MPVYSLCLYILKINYRSKHINLVVPLNYFISLFQSICTEKIANSNNVNIPIKLQFH